MALKKMEKRSSDNDIDDSNNNSNKSNNSNNSNSNDKIFPNPVLGELGTQPAVFTDETKTPTTSATTSTTTTGATTTTTTAASAKAISRLHGLRDRALRLQKK